MKELYVLNGTHMLSYFQKQNVDDSNDIVHASFNEAMCWGEVTEDIFSDSFIWARSKSLNVTSHEYINHVIDPLKFFFQLPQNITFWHDNDMFCQINLLTLLAFLDQIHYSQFISFNLVNYSNQIIESHSIAPLGIYKKLYTTVLIEKRMPIHVPLACMKKGIEQYLEIQKPNNIITNFIESNLTLSDNELVQLLLKEFQDYGLGDTQYLNLIQNIR